MNITRKLFGALLILILVGFMVWTPADLTGTAQQMGQRGPAGITLLAPANVQTIPGTDHWVGEPVSPVFTLAARDLPPSEVLPTLDREINPRMNFGPQPEQDFDPPGRPDPLLALQAGAPAAQIDGFDTPIFNFNGQGYTFLNPPDTVGDVGKDHFIQMINATRVAIYDKNSADLVIPPFNLSALGGCATGWGDPIVLYDQLADRWFLSEFGPSNSLCTYVSQTPDPTGAYYSYQFNTPSFPDYPKYGVWPDAYYVTTNESSPANYALNRAAMLVGSPATAQRFTAPGLPGFGFEALTPADLDGMTPPPVGAPNYIMRHVDTEAHGVPGYPDNDILEIWAFSVNWTTPGNSTFTKIADILTAEFDSTLCGLTSFFCMGMPGVPQGSGNSLDPLREVIMHRLGYRNFGTHEVLVGNFVTDIGDNIGGIRWFELRKVGAGAWELYQEGTYAPTTNDNRWMGGIAMDGSGNIALGYNVSSQTIYPSIRYAGRLASDPLGTLPQGEYTLVNGSAINGSNRYGDYSAMGIDPIDDCTFWFTGEWNDATQWKTRIGAFRFDACGVADFTLSATPSSQDVCVATDAVYEVAVGQVQTYDDPVTLSASGNPVGTSAAFSVNPVTPPGSSLLTIGNTGAALAGTYAIDVIGVAPTSTHTTTVQLNLFTELTTAPTLLSPAHGTTDIPVQPTFTWDAVSGSTSYFIEIATDAGFNNVVDSATVAETSYTVGTQLGGSTLYYWRVTADNACGSSTSTAYFFVTEAVNLVCNTTPVTIPSSGAATPYPSSISVSGYGNNLSDVNVHLLGLSHTWPDDIDMLLVGPQGQNLIIMSDVGGNIDLVDVNLILDDAAAGPMPDSGPITSGTYRPTNIGAGDTFPAPAPAPSSATTLATFNSTDPNGTWSLYIVDDASGDLGNMAGGWCLELAVAGGGSTGIELTKTVGTDPDVYPTTNVITVTSGVSVTYFYVVENTGSVSLPLHRLEDTQLGTVLGPDYAYDLTPGELMTVTASAVATESVTNTAVWLATDGGVTTVVASDSATVNVLPFVAAPAIELVKTVGTTPGVCAATDAITVPQGSEVTYCYTVENSGNVTLDFHTLEDSELGNLLVDFNFALAPGASYFITETATINVTTINTATWTAFNAGPSDVVTATATATVTAVFTPSPTVTILSPQDGAIFTGTNGTAVTIPVVITTTDFTIPDDGHWHLWLNGVMVEVVMGYTTNVDLLPGMHTISAELYTPEHVSLGIVDTVTVTVDTVYQLYLPAIMNDAAATAVADSSNTFRLEAHAFGRVRKNR